MRLIRWMFAGVVFAGLALPGCSRDEPPPAKDGLTVMTFNISRTDAPVILSQVATAIRAAGADIVGLQEAEGDGRRIADMLGWDYADDRLNLISRFPLYYAERDGVGFAYVEVASGKVVAIANTRLPHRPYGPYAVRDGAAAEKVLQIEADTRMPVLAPFAATLPSLAAEKVPTFLIGDFNAPSHLDWTTAASKVVAATKYPLEWPESKLLADKGFIDSYRAVHPNPVTKPGITWSSGYPHPLPEEDETFDRIDLVYSIGPAKPVDSKVVGENSKQSDIGVDSWPSDHRAVVSTFEIEPGPIPDLVTVEPGQVAVGDPFVVRVATAKRKGLSVGIFQADAGKSAPAVTSQPLDGSEAEFGSLRLKPGRYIAAVMDTVGKQLAIAEFSVTEPTAKPRIRLAKTGIYPGDPISLMWMGAPGGKFDWIGIYKVDEPNLASYLARFDANASAHGTATFEAGAFGKALAPGKYEARLMRGGGYVELANTRFVVANPNAKPEISIAPARIRLGEPINVSFKDAPGEESDRIGLYKAGDSSTDRLLTHLPTGGAIAGQITFTSDRYRNKLPPGEYVARLLADRGNQEIASARFWVIGTDGAPLVTLAKPRIKAGEPIEVHWVSAPANERTWIGVYQADDPDLTHVLAQRPGAATDGAVTFKAEDFTTALAPGDYKVRLMREDRSTELANVSFTVLDPNAIPEVTLVKSPVKAGEPVQVSWKRSPGNRHDWIGLYKAGVSNTHSYITWLYTDGAIDGAVTFKSLPPGEYVARLLVDNGYEEVAVSAPFTVTAP